jgi:hypothetical protein
MTLRTIEITEKTYAWLLKQAARLHTTPEELLERVLASNPVLLGEDDKQDMPLLEEPAATAEALAAVQRLTSLFADVSIPDLEMVLDDPMLALENSTLLDQAP